MNRTMTRFLLAGASLCLLLGCKGGDNDDAIRQVNQANDKVVACKSEVNELKSQVSTLKRQVAQAAAHPTDRLDLTDPEILNLVADIRKQRRGAEGDEVAIGKGDLNHKTPAAWSSRTRRRCRCATNGRSRRTPRSSFRQAWRWWLN